MGMHWLLSDHAVLAPRSRNWRKAPGLHTYPELIRVRHGTAAHLSYLFFALLTNLLVGASMVLGGAQVVSALTGVNVYAACFIV